MEILSPIAEMSVRRRGVNRDMKRILLPVLLFACAPFAAQAEDLVSGLSQDQIQITSNYTGTDIVVFGAIEQSDETGGIGDVVVAVRGPDEDIEVRRKARIAGIWVNRDAIRLDGMPGYYYLASTRPLEEIASGDTLRRYALGVDNLYPRAESTRSPRKAEPFREAAIRARQRTSLYTENPAGVEFLGYTLFRVRVPVPATVPRGQYTAEVYLFKNGAVTSAQSTPLFVDQIGIERQVFAFAHAWPLAYGLAAVVLAVALGWLSSLVFRQRM